MHQWVLCKLVYNLYTFPSDTAWGKWQLEKKNQDPALELVAYVQTRKFSYASHRCGHDSLSLITIDMVTGKAKMLQPLRTHAQSLYSTCAVQAHCIDNNQVTFTVTPPTPWPLRLCTLPKQLQYSTVDIAQFKLHTYVNTCVHCNYVTIICTIKAHIRTSTKIAPFQIHT